MKEVNTSLTILLFAVLFVFSANAQKLPNIQEASLHAPATIKIDGKPTEWNNQFQAFNKTAEVFYTIANDNNNLYLTIRVTDLDIINKVITGGITFTINGSGKMKDTDGAAITFPVHSSGTAPFNLDKPEPMQDNAFMDVLNERLSSKTKDIMVTGIKEIMDPVISVYNQKGIKAAALFDDKILFTYELAIPLKYFSAATNDLKQLVYNIKLNGTPKGRTRSVLNEGLTGVHVVNGVVIYEGPTAARIQDVLSPTDFWGEYTLAK